LQDKLKKPFISVAMLTRDGLVGMIEVFHSYIDACENLDDIEFLVGQDEDDVATITQFKGYQERVWGHLNFKYVVHPQGRGWAELYKSWNELYEECSGKWLSFASDDCYNQTKHWDRILRDRYKDKFAHIRTVVHPMPTHPTSLCPITSRKYIDLIGHLGLNTQWDEWLSEIARDLGFQIHDTDFQFNHPGPFRSVGKYTCDKYYNEDRPLWEKDKQKVKDYLESLKSEKKD